MIFDEVITGFRVAAGGAQQHYGVTPDLATYAKIVAGGFPGGAVAGRRDILDQITTRADPEWNARHRVPHQGTFNANPITAAAGLATLKLVAETDVIARANRAAETLRNRLNEIIRQSGDNWLAYGQFSGFHLFTNPQNRDVSLQDIYTAAVPPSELRTSASPSLTSQIRCAMILGGADIFPWPGGCVSAVHTDQDIETTAQALKRCLELLRNE